MTASAPLLASIDIGTNSALLLIAEKGQGPLRPVLQRIATPRVGRGVGAAGRIADESFAALLSALDGFLGEIRAAGARLAGVAATEAFRKASNGPALLAQLADRLGAPCRILSGEEEARLAWLAVADRHPLPGLAVLDIGAGSTEVTTREGGVSLPVGAVVLQEAFPEGPGQAEACRALALEAFRGGLADEDGFSLPENLVAVGGTASALAMLKLDLNAFDSAAIEGLEITRAEVGAALDRLAALPIAARAAMPGLDPGRAEIIIPGLCILDAFLEFAGRDCFRVSDRGIRYGLILDHLGANP